VGRDECRRPPVKKRGFEGRIDESEFLTRSRIGPARARKSGARVRKPYPREAEDGVLQGGEGRPLERAESDHRDGTAAGSEARASDAEAGRDPASARALVADVIPIAPALAPYLQASTPARVARAAERRTSRSTRMRRSGAARNATRNYGLKRSRGRCASTIFAIPQRRSCSAPASTHTACSASSATPRCFLCRKSRQKS